MPSADSLPVAVASPGSASERLEVGAVWLGRFRVEKEHRPGSGLCTSTATRLEDGRKVWLHQVSASADHPLRREVIKRLEQGDPVAGTLELLETVARPDGRVEIFRAPSGPSLAEWLSQRDLEPGQVLPLAQQLARAVLAVHERGLLLLRLSPANVYLTGETADGIEVGGLEHAVPFGAEGVVGLPSDPHLIPPEGVGTTHLPANDALKSWDWWTLGRLVQEMVLGKPVAVHLLQREVPRDGGEARLEAEALLNEGQAHNLRAGAVEAMPAPEPAVLRLLRGLLTGPKDARWRAQEVQQWLDGKTVGDRYELPRGSVLLPLGGDRLTLPELAARFGDAEHWDEGVAQFAAKEPPAGSAVEALLAAGAGMAEEREWFVKVGEFREAAAMRGFVAGARNDVLAAVAWLGVAPAGTRFRWKGRLIDLDLLRELSMDANGLDRLRVLCSRNIIDLVQPRDAATARALRTWGFDWDEAFGLAEKYRWAPSAATRCRLAAQVFAPPEAKNAALKEGREKYHLTTVAPLQAIFSAESLSSGQLGLIAYTLERAGSFGYVTHVDFWRGEEARLRTRGESLVVALRNLKASAALQVGLPLSCGTASWWTTIALVAISMAVFWPGVWGALCALGVFFIMVVLRLRTAAAIRRIDPPADGERWRWSGAAERLRVAAGKLAGLSGRLRVAGLRTELEQVNQQLTQLTVEPRPKAVAARLGMSGVWFAGITAWVVVLGAIGVSIAQAVRAKWTPDAVVSGWMRDLERINAFYADVDLPPPPPEPDSSKPAWPYVSSGVVHALDLVERSEATERQLIAMKSFLLALQEAYDPSTLRGILAAPVSGPEGSTSLMLIDVATSRLISRTVYQVAQPPVRQMTIEVDGVQAMYLDGP